jgi:hypothetical protein
VYTERLEAFTRIINCFEVIYRIGQRPREPKGNTAVHIGYVDFELVSKVTAEEAHTFVQVDVAVIVTRGQVCPCDLVRSDRD